VLKLNLPNGKELDFIFYSLDNNLKNNLIFLKEIKDNLDNFLEIIQNPKFEKFNKDLWYNYGKSAGYFGTVKAVVILPLELSNNQVFYGALLNLNKKIKIPENKIIPITVKNYDNIRRTTIIFSSV